VCGGLYEKDKIAFAFLIALEILISNNEVSIQEQNLLFGGEINTFLLQKKYKESEIPTWINHKKWNKLLYLQSIIAAFRGNFFLAWCCWYQVIILIHRIDRIDPVEF